MKTRVCLWTMALFLLFGMANGQLVFPSLNEINYNYSGGGARAFSMGDAFIGLSDDISGGSWNPAGIWVLEGPMMSASFNSYRSNGQYQQTLSRPWFWTESPAAVSNNLDASALGHFAFATPMRVKGHPVVFTFNYLRNNDKTRYIEALTNIYSEMDVDTYAENHWSLKSFNFGFGTRVYEQLSFGITANIYWGRHLFDAKQVSVQDVIRYGGPDPITVEVVATGTRLDSTTVNGFNVTAGLKYKFEKVSLGAVIHTPFTMRNSTDQRTDLQIYANGLEVVGESGATFVNDSIAKQEIPWSGTFGIGFSPTENWNLSLDIVAQNYGSVDWFKRDSVLIRIDGTNDEFFSKEAIDWNSTLGFGIGAEYLVNTGIGTFPLRAGFRYDQLPQPSEYEIVTNEYYDGEFELIDTDFDMKAWGRQSSHSFSVGTGIHWSMIRLDFGYRYTTGQQLTVTQIERWWIYAGGWVWSTDNIRTEERMEEKAHEFRFTFSGNF